MDGQVTVVNVSWSGTLNNFTFSFTLMRNFPGRMGCMRNVCHISNPELPTSSGQFGHLNHTSSQDLCWNEPFENYLVHPFTQRRSSLEVKSGCSEFCSISKHPVQCCIILPLFFFLYIYHYFLYCNCTAEQPSWISVTFQDHVRCICLMEGIYLVQD